MSSPLSFLCFLYGSPPSVTRTYFLLRLSHLLRSWDCSSVEVSSPMRSMDMEGRRVVEEEAEWRERPDSVYWSDGVDEMKKCGSR
jgi:hypothetical protein